MKVIALHGEVHDTKRRSRAVTDRISDDLKREVGPQIRHVGSCPQRDVHGPARAMGCSDPMRYARAVPTWPARALPAPTPGRARKVEGELFHLIRAMLFRADIPVNGGGPSAFQPQSESRRRATEQPGGGLAVAPGQLPWGAHVVGSKAASSRARPGISGRAAFGEHLGACL